MKPPKRLFRERRNPAYKTTRRYHTAVHEAGHAVSAVVLGLGLRWVDIKPRQLPDGGFSLGATMARDLANLEVLGVGEEGVMPFLIHTLTGVAAESWVNPEVLQPDYMVGTADWAIAWQLATMSVCEYVERDGIAQFGVEEQARCLPRLQAMIQHAREEALRLVEEHRTAIMEVAERLMRRTRLEGEDVEAILAVSPSRVE